MAVPTHPLVAVPTPRPFGLGTTAWKSCVHVSAEVSYPSHLPYLCGQQNSPKFWVGLERFGFAVYVQKNLTSLSSPRLRR